MRSPFPRLQGWILSSFQFLPSQGWSSGLCKLPMGWDLCWVFCLFVFLFVFPLMGKAVWGGNPVCWWLGFYFCFVCCLEGTQGTTGGSVMCWSCVQVVSFVWVLTIWYSLGLVLWWSTVLESVPPILRLRVWSLVRNKDSTSVLLWH